MEASGRVGRALGPQLDPIVWGWVFGCGGSGGCFSAEDQELGEECKGGEWEHGWEPSDPPPERGWGSWGGWKPRFGVIWGICAGGSKKLISEDPSLQRP